MKVRQIRDVLENQFRSDPDVSMFIEALKKFDGISVSVLTAKVSSMRLPTVDPDDAATKLMAVFSQSQAFEQLISEMESDRNYTKAVFFHIFAKLFPNRTAPAKSTTRPALIESIRVMRRREENFQTS